MIKKVLYFVLTFFTSFAILAQQSTLSPLEDRSLIEISGSNKDVIQKYLKVHKKFFNRLCSGGTEQKFWKLMKDYNGFGYYVPRTHDEKLDEATINRFIPEIQSKYEWINEQIAYVRKLSKKDIRKRREEIDRLQKGLEKLLDLKKKAVLSDSEKKRKKAKIRSQYRFVEYRNQWEEFVKKVPFLLSYQFPVDHFDLRLTYDRHKNKETAKGKKKSNQVYFYRKIVQDGAPRKKEGRSDRFLRAALDTVYLKLQKKRALLPDSLRYDLEYVLPTLDGRLSRGRRNTIERLEEWKERTKGALEFYKSLKENKVKVDDHYETGKEFISSLSKARHALKTFSLKKQAETYEYWKEQDELMRALFSLETILYNEVADLDGPKALERRDVAQVVMNRTRLQRYSSIVPGEPLHSHLSQQDKLLSKYDWLNVLFKEGEFSFTYYFIHGNVRIFCPEMTRRGRFLRRKNLGIALERLREPKFNFEAIRYFSRRSMLGRINMAKIWDDFEPIKERPGPQISQLKTQTLKNLYKEDLFDFLYEFESPKGKTYQVLRMPSDKEYVYHPESEEFYMYRNPYFFRYFKPLSE